MRIIIIIRCGRTPTMHLWLITRMEDEDMWKTNTGETRGKKSQTVRTWLRMRARKAYEKSIRKEQKMLRMYAGVTPKEWLGAPIHTSPVLSTEVSSWTSGTNIKRVENSLGRVSQAPPKKSKCSALTCSLAARVGEMIQGVSRKFVCSLTRSIGRLPD